MYIVLGVATFILVSYRLSELNTSYRGFMSVLRCVLRRWATRPFWDVALHIEVLVIVDSMTPF